jgi:hypothetical protein
VSAPQPRACGHLDYDTPHIRTLGFGVPALELVSLGYAVLPLARGGKRPHHMLDELAPRGQGGVHLASADHAQIRYRYSLDRAAGIGVPTGQVNQLAVIDLDVKHDDDGPDNFARFLAANGLQLPAAPWSRTPSGGFHLWLRTPPGVPVPERGRILPGVDVKGDGGYVVAPPSMLYKTPLDRPGEHDGGEPVLIPYTWAEGWCPCRVPMAPPWLLPWLASAPPAGGGGSGGSGEAAPDLAELARTGIERGKRNKELHRLACSLYRRQGSTSPVVLEELRRVWEASDQAGLPWREVLVIAGSARRSSPGGWKANGPCARAT